MKFLKASPLLVVAIGLSLFSCKKKHDTDFVGPAKETNYSLIETFKVNTHTVDFSSNDNNKLYFKAKLDKPGTVSVTIRGLESFAQKTFYFSNVSELDSSISWNGSQDSLYYFRTSEKCVVTLSVGGEDVNNEVKQQLRDRGEVVSSATVLASDTILIKKRRDMPSNQVELFPKYPLTRSPEKGYNFLYTIGYDIENGVLGSENSDRSLELNEKNGVTEHVSDNTMWLAFDPYQKTIRGTQGDRFFVLKGQDVKSSIYPYGPDYYIGRFQSPNLKSISASNIFAYGNEVNQGKDLTVGLLGMPAENLYFNVFIYGNGDGSQINYTVKEKESPAYKGNDFNSDFDEAYQSTIKVNFKGWKLISIPYSKFTYTEQKNAETGELVQGQYANKEKNPEKIMYVQFSLVAGRLGGLGQMIIDCPVMSWGGPLQY